MLCTGHIIRGLADLPDEPSGLMWLRGQHLQGITYRLVKGHQSDRTGVDVLEKAYYATFGVNMYMLSAIEDLEAPLAAQNVSILIIKGAALVDCVYSDPGCRPMEDIDILVHPDNRRVVETILEDAGYARDRGYPHIYSKNKVVIDLHEDPVHADRFTGRQALFCVDMDHVRRDSLPWRPGFVHIRRPCDADHLVIMAHHMIKHSFSKWIWLYDAYMLVNRFDDDGWEALAQKTMQYRQEKAVALMLYMTDRGFGVRAPDGLPFAAWVKQLSFLEKAILEIKASGGDISDLGNLLWLFCIRGYKGRLRFLRGALFPSGDRPETSRLQHLPVIDGCSGKRSGSAGRVRRLGRNLKVLIKGVLESR